ncbi:hypothetical protein SAMD00019534_043160 [Acytostelium subglobosum LB1]|uniref:hypothetical protein n=1 Tax=Acytostelium subglobosum LB1 TaxID=1410327 RepID=UPI000644ECDF|nr:hypothetical protein SAMD00019534_043160 [Acytostelium subglobosum LB1]GAM21141.1 hypothetical protein SAMD00019534_043160 [Acytostelium subglobosum LB1]|eukprot:XP_012756275.1 hypothetical protein SAMD00019534_043160 [Acytostelium subglobosum LB1]
MHIGSGMFHRAHQAYYLDKLNNKLDEEEKEKENSGISRWSIALGNIRDDVGDILEVLQRQHCKYTLETVDSVGDRQHHVIKSIKIIVPYDQDGKHLVQQGAHVDTKVISFTVTESGYYYDVNLQLVATHPDIQHDLKGGCKTIYGSITKILRERMKITGTADSRITLLSCDNVRKNGVVFKTCYQQFLEMVGDKMLLEWFQANTTCPNTMVDRITPRPPADLVARVATLHQDFEDRAPVMCEKFTQWVIEDNFIIGRPALEKVGVEFTQDVKPYEEAKVRILNASHCILAWGGTLKGYTYIHEGMRDPQIKTMAYDYITNDVIPTLKAKTPLNLESYRDIALDRFSNPYLADTNQRVSSEGYTKIPGFVVPTITACFQRGDAPRSSIRLVALFFVLLQRSYQGKLPYIYVDAVLTKEMLNNIFKATDPVQAFAHDQVLFGTLKDNAQFVSLVHEEVVQVNAWLG